MNLHKVWNRLPAPTRRLTREKLSRHLFADHISYRAFWNSWNSACGGDPIEVGLKPLGGKRIELRPGTDDHAVVLDTFLGRYHLPPRTSRRQLGSVWDLGAHIGLVAAHLAELSPHCRVVACEMDAENVQLATRNLRFWQDRIKIIHTAISAKQGEVSYDRTPSQTSEFSILNKVGSGSKRTAPGMELADMFRNERVGVVDFLKVDIEGAEKYLLQGDTSWAHHVRCINLEVHAPNNLMDFARGLTDLGFSISINRKHRASLMGTK